MNAKERISALLNNQPVDHIPFAVLDAGAWAVSKDGYTFRQLLELEDAGASVIYNNINGIDSDLISVCGAFAAAPLDIVGCHLNIDSTGSTIDVGKCFDDPEEQISTLDKSTIKDGLAKSWIWQRLLLQTRELKKLAGDEKFTAGALFGPFSFAGMMIGAQDLMMMLVDEDAEDDLAALLDYCVELQVEAYKQLAEAGLEIAWPCEPVASGAMISQKMFEDFALEPIKQTYDRIKDDFTFVFLHMCGNSSERVKSISRIGYNAFSVDAPVDMEKACLDIEGNMVMFGNVSPANPLHSGTPADVKAAAEEIVRKVKAANGRMILAPGCDVPVGTPVENLNALRDVALAN